MQRLRPLLLAAHQPGCSARPAGATAALPPGRAPLNPLQGPAGPATGRRPSVGCRPASALGDLVSGAPAATQAVPAPVLSGSLSERPREVSCAFPRQPASAGLNSGPGPSGKAGAGGGAGGGVHTGHPPPGQPSVGGGGRGAALGAAKATGHREGRERGPQGSRDKPASRTGQGGTCHVSVCWPRPCQLHHRHLGEVVTVTWSREEARRDQWRVAEPPATGSQPGPDLTERPRTPPGSQEPPGQQGTQETGKPSGPRFPLFLGQKWAGGGQR